MFFLFNSKYFNQNFLMGDAVNYLLFTNPVSQSAWSVLNSAAKVAVGYLLVEILMTHRYLFKILKVIYF